MVSLLATCEAASGSSRGLEIVIPPLIVVTWGWVVWRVVNGAEESSRPKLFVLFVVASAVGAFVFFYPDEESVNGNHLDRFWLGLGIAVAVGGISARLPPRTGIVRSVLMAVAGDVLLPGGIVLLFVWSLALGNTCLD